MKTLISLITLGISAAAFAAPQIHGSDPAQAIMIKPNQKTFSILLSANATTGYRWFLGKVNHKYFQYQSDNYLAPKTQLVGAPGFAIYTFRVKRAFHRAPYMTDISFIYAQPWNLGTKQVAHYEVISIPGKPAQKKVHKAHQAKHAMKMMAPHLMTKPANKPQPKPAPKPAVKKANEDMNTSWLSLPKK